MNRSVPAGKSGNRTSRIFRDGPTGKHRSVPSPLKTTELIIDMLRQDPVSQADVQERLKSLLESLKKRFGSSWNQALIEDTVQFAPWLTAKMERLKKQQSELLQSLTSCCLQARRLKVSEEVRVRLVEQLTDFAESYVETETDQECLFHTAFPSPDWTAQPRSG